MVFSALICISNGKLVQRVWVLAAVREKLNVSAVLDNNQLVEIKELLDTMLVKYVGIQQSGTEKLMERIG